MSNPSDYLVSLGTSGDFGRFRVAQPASYERGHRVIVRTAQGLQIGLIMCPALADHDKFLAPKPSGDILRAASTDDDVQAEKVRIRGEQLFIDAAMLVRQHEWPMEILDVEVTLDEKQATVSYLADSNVDYRDLVRSLSRRHDILIVMQNLCLPAENHDETHGCDRPDCGKGEGGCTSCSSGGCSSGGCASGAKMEDVAAYLAEMESSAGRNGRRPLN